MNKENTDATTTQLSLEARTDDVSLLPQPLPSWLEKYPPEERGFLSCFGLDDTDNESRRLFNEELLDISPGPAIGMLAEEACIRFGEYEDSGLADRISWIEYTKLKRYILDTPETSYWETPDEFQREEKVACQIAEYCRIIDNSGVKSQAIIELHQQELLHPAVTLLHALRIFFMYCK